MYVEKESEKSTVKDKKDRVGYVITDSMASNQSGSNDTSQKLIEVSKSFIAGTGAGDIIGYVNKILKDNEEDIPENAYEVGKVIVDIVNKKFRPSDTMDNNLQFGIMGKNPEGDLTTYQVAPLRILDAIEVSGCLLLGSGACKTVPSIELSSRFGLDIPGKIKEPIHGFLYLLNLAEYAENVPSVNDKFQIGFNYKGKTATVYHPEVAKVLEHVPKNFNKENNDEGTGSDEISGTEIMTIIMMSNVDLVKYQDTFRELLLNGVAFVSDTQKMTQHIYDNMSIEDSEKLMGEYISNFLLLFSMKALTKK